MTTLLVESDNPGKNTVSMIPYPNIYSLDPKLVSEATFVFNV